MTKKEQKRILEALRAMITISTMYPELCKHHKHEINGYREMLNTDTNDEILYGKKVWDQEFGGYVRMHEEVIAEVARVRQSQNA